MWRREETRYGRNIASCASVGVSRRWYPIWGIILVIKLVQWRWTNISIRLNYCTCVLVQLIEEMEGSYYSWCKCKKWKNCNFTKEVEGKKGKSVEHLVSRATINGSIHQRLNGTACDISRAACLQTIGGRRRVSFPRWTRIEILPPRELTRTSNRNLSNWLVIIEWR